MTTTKKVLTGMALGVAAGALLGILFAPHKGSKTRKRLLNRGRDVVRGFEEKAVEGKDAIKQFKKGVTQAVKDKLEKYSLAGGHKQVDCKV